MRTLPMETLSALPFSMEADPAEVELLARHFLQGLALDFGVQIVEGKGDVGIEAERRFRFQWWTTGDEALPLALYRAKTFVYQNARTARSWPRLTDAWKSAELEIHSDRWREHLRRITRELSPSDQAYLRLANRAAQQAASRAARWQSLFPCSPSPFDRLVELFAHGAWPLGCYGDSLWVLLWNPRTAYSPRFGPPSLVLCSKPEEHQLFLSAPFRDRELSTHWRRALEQHGWQVIHGPVREEERPPEVQLGHRIREASAVLGLLDQLDPDFGLPWWMFQELDYACACGQPVALVARGESSELPDVHRIDTNVKDPTEVIEQKNFREWLQRIAQVKRRDTFGSTLALTFLIGWFLILFSSLTAAQTTVTTPAPQAGSAAETPDPLKQKLEIAKLQAELNKLKEETQALKLGNAAIGKVTRQATAWGSAIGGIFGALVTLLVALVGFYFSDTQRRKLTQDKDLEQKKHSLEVRKLEQERTQEHVQHLLGIFRDLGSEQARIRMGAIAILVQMIKRIRSGGSETDKESSQDLPTIISTLIIASKHEDKVEVQKQIADGLAQGLAALIPEGQKPLSKNSPLVEYDFQGARLENAWWKGIDARGVDFYGACLVRAGLRQAHLSRAVLKKAELQSATLEDADLEEADLQGADLSDVRAARAHFRGANLKGADLTKADLRDADLNGALLAGAKFRGTKLAGATLAGADLSGADLSEAVLE